MRIKKNDIVKYFEASWHGCQLLFGFKTFAYNGIKENPNHESYKPVITDIDCLQCLQFCIIPINIINIGCSLRNDLNSASYLRKVYSIGNNFVGSQIFRLQKTSCNQQHY